MENKKICSSHFSGLQVFYLFGSIWRLVFYGGMFIFYLQSLRREANSHTAHEKKYISLLLCIIPKHKGRG
jgi:hypothetical protein